MLEPGAFFVESCLVGHLVRTATAEEVTTLARIDKEPMILVLHKQPAFSELFMSYLLSHNMGIEEDLVDHTLQFQREAARARVALVGAFREGG